MLVLSDHAKQRFAQRLIELEWIAATIAAPDWTAPDHDSELTRSFKVISAFGNRVLKVVHRPDGADILVITAYFDRGARRP